MSHVVWTSRLQAKLERVYAQGGDWRAIAKAMRMTKGQVLGRLWRSGLLLANRRKPVNGRHLEVAELGAPAELLRLHPDGCKWGIGEAEGRHIFCNRPRVTSSYCADHSRGYSPSVPRRAVVSIM